MERHPLWLPMALWALLAAQAATAKEPLYVLVTPERVLAGGAGGAGGGGRFSCEVVPEATPPKVENDLVRFKVTVKGRPTPMQWRIPLYEGANGDNGLAVARIGVVTPEPDGHFIIDLNVTDLQRVMDRERIVVQVRSQEGLQATCATASAPVSQALLRMEPKELLIVNGAAGR